MESEPRPGRRGRPNTRCRETSRATGGLRFFSLKVVEKIRARARTTYNAVANELVNDLNNSGGNTKDGKSIRRRCYDAINVLLACGLIKRDDKKQILWRGHGSIELDRLRAELETRRKEVERKRLLLQDVEQKHKALEAFLERTASRAAAADSPESGSGSGGASCSACSRSSQGQKITMPFVLVQAGADVNVIFSNDRTNVEFELPERPLQVHDDCAVLLKLHQHEAERHAQPQHQAQQRQQEHNAKGPHMNTNAWGPGSVAGSGPTCVGSPQAPPSDVAPNNLAAHTQQLLPTPAPSRPQALSQGTEQQQQPPTWAEPALQTSREMLEPQNARGQPPPCSKERRSRKRQGDPLSQPGAAAVAQDEDRLQAPAQPLAEEALHQGQGQQPTLAVVAHLPGQPALLARAHCQQQPPQHHQLAFPQRLPPVLPPIRQLPPSQHQSQFQLQPSLVSVKPEPQCCEMLGLRIPRLRPGLTSVNLLGLQQQAQHPCQQLYLQQRQQLEQVGQHQHDLQTHQQHGQEPGQLGLLQQYHSLYFGPQPQAQSPPQQQQHVPLPSLPETPLGFTLSEDLSQLLSLPLDQHDSNNLMHTQQHQQQLQHVQLSPPQINQNHSLMLGGSGGEAFQQANQFGIPNQQLHQNHHHQPQQQPHPIAQLPLLQPAPHQPLATQMPSQPEQHQQMPQQSPPPLQPQLSLEQHQLLSMEQMVDEDEPLLGSLLPFSGDDSDPLGFGMCCPSTMAADQLGYMGWPYSINPDPSSPTALFQCRPEPPSSRHPSAYSVQVGLQR